MKISVLGIYTRAIASTAVTALLCACASQASPSGLPGAYGPGANGGYGAGVEATIPVTPGETPAIFVRGKGNEGGRAAVTSPCDMPNDWYFEGSCTEHVLPSSGWKYSLVKYRGYALTASVPSNNGNGTAKLYASDATGRGDITGRYKGKSFAPYGTNCYVNGKKAACPGKVFLYLHVTSTNTKTITLHAPVTATVSSDAGYSGTKCFPGFLEKGWDVETDLAEKPNGHTLSLTFGKASQKQDIAVKANYVIAFVCE